MQWINENRSRIIGWGGLVITVIGLVSLPASLSTWGNRFQDLGDMTRDNPAAAIAIVVGVALVIWGNWEMVTKAFGAKRWRSDKQLGDELHGWLRLRMYQMRDQEIDEATIAFTARDPVANRAVTIIKLAEKPVLSFQAGVVPSEDHKLIIEKMDSGQLRAMLSDLALEIARSGVSFDGTSVLDPGVLIGYEMPVSDSLTEELFMERVNFMQRVIMVVQVIISRHAGAEPPAPDMTLMPSGIDEDDQETQEPAPGGP